MTTVGDGEWVEVTAEWVHAHMGSLRGRPCRLAGEPGTVAGSTWMPDTHIFLMRLVDEDGTRVELALGAGQAVEVTAREATADDGALGRLFASTARGPRPSAG